MTRITQQEEKWLEEHGFRRDSENLPKYSRRKGGVWLSFRKILENRWICRIEADDGKQVFSGKTLEKAASQARSSFNEKTNRMIQADSVIGELLEPKKPKEESMELPDEDDGSIAGAMLAGRD